MGKADFNIEVTGNPRTASGQLAAIADDLMNLICKWFHHDRIEPAYSRLSDSDI